MNSYDFNQYWGWKEGIGGRERPILKAALPWWLINIGTDYLLSSSKDVSSYFIPTLSHRLNHYVDSLRRRVPVVPLFSHAQNAKQIKLKI